MSGYDFDLIVNHVRDGWEYRRRVWDPEAERDVWRTIYVDEDLNLTVDGGPVTYEDMASDDWVMCPPWRMGVDRAFGLLKRGCSIRRLAWTEGAWLIPITVPPGAIDGDYAMRCPSGEVEDYRLTIEDVTSDDWEEVDRCSGS